MLLPQSRLVCRIALAIVAFTIWSNTAWTQQVEQSSIMDDSEVDLGKSFDISNGILIAGAPLEDGAFANTGAAYVYDVRQNQNPILLHELKAPDAMVNDRFGSAVATDGELVAVARNRYIGELVDFNAIYLYDVGSGQLQSIIEAPDGYNGFGQSLALHEGLLFIGAPRFMVDNRYVGITVTYDVNDPQAPMLLHQLQPGPSDDIAGYGWNISLHNGMALISSAFGPVDLFHAMESKSPVHIARIANPTHDDWFYTPAIDINDSYVIVGDSLDSTIGSGSGALHVFHAEDGLFHGSMLAPDAQSGDRFGAFVTLAGTTAVIAAPDRDYISYGRGTVFVLDVERLQHVGRLRPASYDSSFTLSRVVTDGQTTAVRTHEYSFSHELESQTGVMLFNGNGPCPADLVRSGTVDVEDVGVVLDQWGPCPSCAADLNFDGVVDEADLTIVQNTFGPCPGWEPPALLSAQQVSGDHAGTAVAINEKHILVRAPLHDTDHQHDGGATFRFMRMDRSEIPYLSGTPTKGLHYRTVGNSEQLSVSGTLGVMLVGNDIGVFDINSGAIQALIEQPEEGSAFSFSLAIDSNVVAIGLPRANEHTGRVETYDARTGDHLRTFFAPDGSPGDMFGTSIALTDEVLIVGAPGIDLHHAAPDRGGVELFDLNTGEHLDQFRPAPANEPLAFGTSIALHEDLLIVGSPGTSPLGPGLQGADVYDLRTRTRIAGLNPPPGYDARSFGASVAIDGNLMIVGAPDEETRRGAAYVYATLLDCPADLNTSSRVDEEDLLIMFASWGFCDNKACPSDLNGDELVDVLDLQILLAAWGNCSPALLRRLTAPLPTAYAHFGSDVATHNGTVAVGMPNGGTLGENSGAAFVYEIRSSNREAR